MALSASRLTLLEKLVSENVSMNDLQRVHGYNHRTVRRYYPKYRLMGNPESSGSTLSEERRGELHSLVRSGETLTKMQKSHGFNYKTVRRYYPNYRNKAVANREDFYEIPKDVQRTVKELVDDRASLKEIQETTGLTRGQIMWLEPNSPWTKNEAGKWRHIVEGAWDLGISI